MTNRKVWKMVVVVLVAYIVGMAAISMLALADDIPIPDEQRPLTGILITQCNEVIAGYVTMPDGRLQRFDKSNEVQMSSPALQALIMSAKAKERIEIGCDGSTYEIIKPNKMEI